MDRQQFTKLKKVYCKSSAIINELNEIECLIEESDNIQSFGYLDKSNYWHRTKSLCFTDMLVKYIDLLYTRKKQLEKELDELNI